MFLLWRITTEIYISLLRQSLSIIGGSAQNMSVSHSTIEHLDTSLVVWSLNMFGLWHFEYGPDGGRCIHTCSNGYLLDIHDSFIPCDSLRFCLLLLCALFIFGWRNFNYRASINYRYTKWSLSCIIRNICLSYHKLWPRSHLALVEASGVEAAMRY